MFRALLGGAPAPGGEAFFFSMTRESLRDNLRQLLGEFRDEPGHEAAAIESTRVALASIRDDSSVGELLQLVKNITWDAALRRAAIRHVVNATGVFPPPPLEEGAQRPRRPLEPTQLSREILSNQATYNLFLEQITGMFVSMRTEDLRRIDTFDKFMAFRGLIVEAYLRPIEDYRTETGAKVTGAKDRLIPYLEAYIRRIDDKTRAAERAGFIATATLFKERALGEESGTLGRSCAEARLTDLRAEDLTLGKLLYIASHTWGKHSEIGMMVNLCNALELTPRGLDLALEHYHLFCRVVKKSIEEALKTLPESERDKFGLAHLHLLKERIVTNCNADPEVIAAVAARRAAQAGAGAGVRAGAGGDAGPAMR